MLIVIFASSMRAILGVSLKQAVNIGANIDTIMLFISGSWLVGGFLYWLLKEKSPKFNVHDFSHGILAGFVLIIVANSLAEALKYGDVIVAASIANLSFIVALGVSILIGMEKITFNKVLALSLATGSILFLAQTA